MKPIILVALICLAAAAELALARHSSLHEWAQYKREHGKVYETPEEDAHRFSLFLAAKERVQRHNENEQASFKLGLNHLSDWTRDELAKLNGFKYDPIEHMKRVEASRDHPFVKAILEDPTPTEADVDYRKDPTRVSPVKNQGQCGSCWAFATTGMLEGQQVVRNFTKSLIPLSEQEIMDCSVNDYECDGGIMSAALEDMVSVGGFNSEKDYPYEAKDMFVCDFKKDKVVMTETGSIELPNDEEIIRQFVAKYGPVAIAIEATDKFHAYTSGVFYDPTCDNHLNHGVLIVGYGTDPDGGDYWIVKNSWTDKWGDGGYIKMKRGEGTCGIGLVSTVARFTK